MCDSCHSSPAPSAVSAMPVRHLCNRDVLVMVLAVSEFRRKSDYSYFISHQADIFQCFPLYCYRYMITLCWSGLNLCLFVKFIITFNIDIHWFLIIKNEYIYYFETTTDTDWGHWVKEWLVLLSNSRISGRPQGLWVRSSWGDTDQRRRTNFSSFAESDCFINEYAAVKADCCSSLLPRRPDLHLINFPVCRQSLFIVRFLKRNAY